MKLKPSSTHNGRQDTGMEGDFTVTPWKHDRIASERNPSLGNLRQCTEGLDIPESQLNCRKVRRVPFGHKGAQWL